MLYDNSDKILKNHSLTSSVYFLLLKEPTTISDLSKIFYGGKVQLSHLNKIIDKLSKVGYIKEYPLSRNQKQTKNIDLRRKYWTATYKPVIEYSKLAIDERKKTSRLKERDNLSGGEVKILESFLNSDWFKKFYDDNFLITQHLVNGEVYKKDNPILSETPIRFFAFMLEEICSIRLTLQKFVLEFKIREYDEELSFDNFIEQNKQLINEKLNKELKLVIKRAKKYLGNYDTTNMEIDYYFRDYAILFIPYKLAEKLQSIGRVPLTVFKAFMGATNQLPSEFI